jgi:L-asparaginase
VGTVLIATGGTIAWDRDRGRMLSGAELASQAGLRFDKVIDLEAKPSWDLSIDEMWAIASAIRAAIDDGDFAVVVTHGTDTLEETAWLTDLTLGPQRRRHASVVFTGAMRFASDPEADGPANLDAALAIAEVAKGQNLGVQVAFAGRTHAARWVVKVDATGFDAFESADRPKSAPPPPSSRGALIREVALLKVGPVARPAIPNNIAGLVLEGTGTSHVPSVYHRAITDLVRRGIPVVVGTRVGDPGAPLTDQIILRAGDLTAEKATIALMVALGTTNDLDQLRTWWAELLFAGS